MDDTYDWYQKNEWYILKVPSNDLYNLILKNPQLAHGVKKNFKRPKKIEELKNLKNTEWALRPKICKTSKAKSFELLKDLIKYEDLDFKSKIIEYYKNLHTT